MALRSLLRFVLPALATWTAALGTAHAQVPRAIVLRFEGWRASQARDAVVEALAPEVQLVTEDRAVAAAEEIGVDVSSPEGMARVVSHLGITLIVAGSVEGRGRSAETVVMVLDPTGNELARRSGPAPQRAADHAGIGAAAVEALREAQSVLARQSEPEPEPEPDAPVEPAEPPPSEAAPAEVGWRPRQLLVLAGVRVRNIGTYIDDSSGRVHFFAADAFPEIDLELSYRPWYDKPDEVRGVFFGIQGSFSVGMAYIATPSNEQRGMTSLRFRLDAGYAHVLGDVVELAGMIGFGVEGVQLDQPEGFPSTLYSFLRPAIGVRVRAVPDFIILEAGIGGRIGLDGGPLAAAYGPSFFFGGVDLYAGVAGRVEPGFSWAARIGYTHHALSISGDMGTFANGIGGMDEVVEGRFLIGWSL